MIPTAECELIELYPMMAFASWPSYPEYWEVQ